MITYSSENVKFPSIKRRETTAWIRRVAATYGKKVGEVGYLFCDDEHILAVNRELSGVETILLYSEPQYSSISSSMVRELQHFGVDVTPFLPKRKDKQYDVITV